MDYYTRHDVKLMVNSLYAEATTKDIKSWKQHILLSVGFRRELLGVAKYAQNG